MKLCTFEYTGQVLPGLVLSNNRVLNLVQALADGPAASVRQLTDIIGGGAPMLELVRAAEARALADTTHAFSLAPDEARLMAPIPRPAKNVFCVGRNYRQHVEEAAKFHKKEVKLPEFVQFFTKPPLSVVGPEDDILWDETVRQKLDYEVELGVVIGRSGRNIPRERALDYVFGYTVINDITARDLQRRHDQWFKGKGLDGSCPMGPWIVPAEEVADPQALEVRLRVNGETRQQASTGLMIFDVREIIAQLSLGLTLEAGDVIATGTPSGVGFAMEPPRLLGDGDMVETEVVGIGTLRNRVRRIEHVQAK